MASQTRQEIATRALKMCGKLALAQAAPSELNDEALQAYDQVYDQLSDLGIVTWAYTAEVPNEFCFWVASMVAYQLSTVISVPAERFQRIARDAGVAESAIRRLYNEQYVSGEIKVSDF